MNKSALIYEFNNDSPLFAQVAAEELENKNVDKALEILEHGIQLFPEYATAYIIYSQALAKIGDFDNAFDMLKKGCDLVNSDEAYKFYSEKLENLKSKSGNISESRRATFIPEDFEETAAEEPEVTDEAIPEPEPAPIEEEPETAETPDELETLASELENAKMPPPEPEPIEEEPVAEEPVEEESAEENFELDDDFLSEEFDDLDIEPFEPDDEPEEEEEDEKEIVSETLAGIYFAQGNLEEALTIYQKLLIYQPDKEEFFKKRIEEINEQLKNDPLI
ncbi:MAG: hypothetical protein ACEPO8_04300 [Rhodothermaceae bacterium]